MIRAASTQSAPSRNIPTVRTANHTLAMIGDEPDLFGSMLRGHKIDDDICLGRLHGRFPQRRRQKLLA